MIIYLFEIAFWRFLTIGGQKKMTGYITVWASRYLYNVIKELLANLVSMLNHRSTLKMTATSYDPHLKWPRSFLDVFKELVRRMLSLITCIRKAFGPVLTWQTDWNVSLYIWTSKSGSLIWLSCLLWRKIRHSATKYAKIQGPFVG